MLATLTLDPLPEGFVCYSASGAFPQCEPCRKENDVNSNLFITSDDAAIGAISEAWLNSDWYNHEYGGEIYRICPVTTLAPYEYSYTMRKGPLVTLLNNGGSVDIFPENLDDSGWHTHPDGSIVAFPELYSFYIPLLNNGGDLEWVQAENKQLYLGTPSGKVKTLPVGSTSINDERLIQQLTAPPAP